MSRSVDVERLQSSLQIAKSELLSRRVSDHWAGRLASSALSTATAVSALSSVRGQVAAPDHAVDALIARGSNYLIEQQREDGGWGDTEQSQSNIATTMLCAAALTLEDPTLSRSAQQVGRADRYLEQHGGIEGLRRRYGQDRTFAVPILMNCALAGRATGNKFRPCRLNSPACRKPSTVLSDCPWSAMPFPRSSRSARPSTVTKWIF